MQDWIREWHSPETPQAETLLKKLLKRIEENISNFKTLLIVRGYIKNLIETRLTVNVYRKGIGSTKEKVNTK